MTDLKRIVIIRHDDDSWSCCRERANGGESCSGLRSLEEVIEYIREHEKPLEEWFEEAINGETQSRS